MKKKLKGFYLLVTSIIIGIMHLPFALAKSATGSKLIFEPFANPTTKTITDTNHVLPSLKSVYDSLQLNLTGLSHQAFDYAKRGLDKLIADGKLFNGSIISIIDFSEPSNKKRLFVLDLTNYKIIFNTLVAHGKNTGREWATSFSNYNASFKSSPGFYITKETYEGKNGYSLKLEGQEKGINDLANERGIVMHGAEYVSDAFVHARGFAGRSLGCPAVPMASNRSIINTIKNGTCLFIYHPDYISHSVVLN